MKPLKLGILGLSPGNGHPYSWAAICNGYDRQAMSTCPFPVIPEYLNQHSFPRDQIESARVTHIWTQEKAVSEHVAAASNIPYVVSDASELLGQVDGVLLARDDGENHLQMSRPFIEAGLPIYIDKPLAYTLDDARAIYQLEQYNGQVFTCSALQFAAELKLSEADKRRLGRIQFVEARTPKDWLKYGVHIIEPVLNLLPERGDIESLELAPNFPFHQVTVRWTSGVVTRFSAMGMLPMPIELSIQASNGTELLTFTDTFAAFKNALEEFIAVANKKKHPPSSEYVLQVIEVLERGSA